MAQASESSEAYESQQIPLGNPSPVIITKIVHTV
jgi:hypothetical protein